MKDRIQEIILHLNQKTLAFVSWIFGVMTFAEFWDAASKLVLFIISAIAGILAIINYILKNQKLRKENALLDQQAFAQALKNKEKEAALKGYASAEED